MSYTFLTGGEGDDWYLHCDQVLLSVKSCLGYTDALCPGGFCQIDTDRDGENELLVRTPWRERPYILYDRADGSVTENWLEALPPVWEQELVG